MLFSTKINTLIKGLSTKYAAVYMVKNLMLNSFPPLIMHFLEYIPLVFIFYVFIYMRHFLRMRRIVAKFTVGIIIYFSLHNACCHNIIIG